MKMFLTSVQVDKRAAHGGFPSKQITTEITGARRVEDLEQALQLKSDFAAALSHDLRTPLTVILGYTDLLLEGVFGALTPEQTAPLQRLVHAARTATELVHATLDLGRLESGRLPLDISEVSIGDLLSDIANEAMESPAAEDVRLTVNLEAPVTAPRTDRLKLRMALRNLIENACKFTPAGGEVRILATAHGDGIEIRVTDTGIGIPQQCLETIFDPFVQSNRAVDRAAGGVGFGLYIVRRLVEVLEGTIGVESEEGVGTTFQLCIPSKLSASARH